MPIYWYSPTRSIHSGRLRSRANRTSIGRVTNPSLVLGFGVTRSHLEDALLAEKSASTERHHGNQEQVHGQERTLGDIHRGQRHGQAHQDPCDDGPPEAAYAPKNDDQE